MSGPHSSSPRACGESSPVHRNKMENVRLTNLRIIHDTEVVLGLEETWDNGVVKSHGVVDVDGAATATDCAFEADEHITKVGIKCSNAERHSHVYAITIHTNTHGMRTRWLGGERGQPKFLEKEGHHVVGFVGRASHGIDALGIITVENNAAEWSIHRGSVYGGPSGIPFADLVQRDVSQLSNFVLSAALKQETSSFMVESARQIFCKMQALCPDSAQEQVLLEEAEQYFKASFVQLSPQLLSPTATKFRDAHASREFTKVADSFPLSFQPFAGSFVVSGTSATCEVSAGWRTIHSSTPLPIREGGAAVVEIGVINDVRTVVLGVCTTDATNGFVGSDATSCGVQSSGHILADGNIVENTEAAYGPNTALFLLVTKTTLAVYKDLKLIATLPVPKSDELWLGASCYLGPNTFTVVGCNIWEKV